MGRGRGRGNFRQRGGGGSRGSSRGISRGRGGRGRGGRGRGEALSRKDVMHLRQFGEQHPSQELGNDFGPSASKRGNFDRGRRGFGRGDWGRGGRGRGDSRFGAKEDPPVSESESSDEDILTPYKELLSVFSGKKPGVPIQIDSDEDEDESDEESSDDDKNDDEIGDVIKEEKESDSVDSDIDDDLDEDIDMEEEKGDSNEEKGDSDEEKGDSVEEKGDSGDEEELSSEEVPEEKKAEVKIKKSKVKEDDFREEPEDTVIDETEIDPELNDATQDLESVDPFVYHYEREMNDDLQKELKSDTPAKQNISYDWPYLEKFTYTKLKKSFSETSEKTPNELISRVNLSELDKLPDVEIVDPPLLPMRTPTLGSLRIKAQFHSTVPIVNQASIDKEACTEPLTSLQSELIDLASRYYDMYIPVRTMENAEEIRVAYCLHAANHVMKTRTRILHHNAKMVNKSEVPEAYRDQGFVRPKVLILVPFKDSALKVVKTLISLILKEEKGNVANKNRFVDEYGGQTLFMPKTNPKPEDYMDTFNGNTEDNFKIGMAITKKSIKLYTGFYSSDIIVASPLGLRMIVGAEGERDRDYDFLSSVEVLIMDQSDVFLMQNWDHVLHIMRHLHLQPVTTHGTDFARIRPWVLDGLAKFYCQTLVFSSAACPEHSSLMSKYCKNYAGQIRVIQSNLKGTIRHVVVQVPQVFQNFDCASVMEVDNARFDFFIKYILPNFTEKLFSHTLVFVSSYFDFVRLRNYFKREEKSFVQICEYTKDKKIARARDYFFHGSSHFLLYTERAHFFRRFRFKGIGHILFYQLPQNPQFYPELCNLMQETFQNRRVRQRKNASVNVLYCKYDAPRLAAIVGTERTSYMLSSEKKIHAFVSGEM